MSKAYRYPGAQPFTANDRRIFYGRDKDTRRLAELIRLEQMIVLYGKSGLGKSSLLNAAVLPRLQEPEDPELSSFLTIPMRFGAYSREHSAVGPTENVLLRLAEYGQGGWPERFGEAAPLWQTLKSIQTAQSDRQVFLVLDQFEELFTYPPEQIRQFATGLAEALYERVPQACRKLLENGTVSLNEAEREVMFQPLNLKVLFAIRSDRMSLLDSLKMQLPDILHKTYELLPLNRNQAEEAIFNPACLRDPDFAVPPFSYTDEALDKILDFLLADKDDAVETTQLQIACQYAERLIEQAEINQKTARGIPLVGAADLGDLTQVYRRYYDDLLGEIPDPTERLQVQRLIEEDLIFEQDQRRLSLYEGVIRSKGISDEMLRLLVGKYHLLRAEPNMSGGYTYELSHDTLVAPILETKKVRVAEEQRLAQEARRREAEADRIRAEKRAAEAERKAAEEGALREEAEKGRKQARVRTRIAVGIAIIAILASGIAWVAFDQARDAETQAKSQLVRAFNEEIKQNHLKIERYERDKEAFAKAEEPVLTDKAQAEIENLSKIIKDRCKQIEELGGECIDVSKTSRSLK